MGAPPLSDELCREALAALDASGGCKTRAAASLGLNRKTFNSRLDVAKSRRIESVSEDKPWSVEELPSSRLPINDLLAKRRDEAQRAKAWNEARNLIDIKVNTAGPIGLMLFGDPHIDNYGCDFNLLESHLAIAAARSRYLFAGNLGDISDNWVGRLQRIYASSPTTVKDAWRLAEWMLRDAGVDWLFLVRGNHDVWSGDSDPLDWIMRGTTSVDERHGVRLSLNHPCGNATRVHVRHDFKGNSQFNGLHGLVKETLWGHRDHIIAAGHRHFGEDGAQVTPEGVTQMVRVSGYKAVDDYAKQGQFSDKRIHPSALIIIDPSRPDTCRSRTWCAPTVEEGAEYLDWLRAKFEGGGKIRLKISA
jgi:hypothetical protein